MKFNGFTPWEVASHNEKQMIVALGDVVAKLGTAVECLGEEVKKIQNDKKMLAPNK